MIVLGRICCSLCCFFLAASRVSCYDEDLPDGYHYQRAFPEEIMVDVINNFGLALLEAHNEGNEDNMALSPYGATSVLVALKEGLRGYAAREIETSVHLPADLSIIRIGLRDVHRHLKSYFIPKEGFLAGLTLSNDKVELLQNYEGILRFYGYDLESFNNPLYPDVFEDANTTLLETTTEITTSPTTNLIISTSVTPETTVAEEYQNVTGENVISTTETILLTTGKVERSTGNESSTSGTEITSTTEENIFTTTAETSTQDQVTKKVALLTTTSATPSLHPTEFERTTGEEDRSTTQSLEVVKTEEAPGLLPTKFERTTGEEEDRITTQSLEVVKTEEAPSLLPIEFERTTGEEEDRITTQSLEVVKTEEAPSLLPTKFERTTGEEEDRITTQSLEVVKTEKAPSLLPTEFERTTGEEEDGITTQSLEVKTEEENMEAMSSITVPIKTSTASTSSTDDVTSENFPEVTTNTVSTISSIDVDGQSSPISTIPLQMELTTSLGKNDSDLNRNETANDAVTSESHVVPVNSTSQNVSLAEEDKESTTDVIVTSITTSVSTSTVKLDGTVFEKPLTTEGIITTSETTTTTTSDSYEEESSYSTDSIENSTGNEVYDYSSDTSEYISTESDYTTEEGDEEGDKTRKSRSIIDYLIARYHDDFHANDKKGRRRFDYEPEESLNFFVYGRIKEPNINFMNYDAVLPFAYLPALDALALSFPLDSSEYYLLLLLPVEVNGIDRLVYDLKKTSSLREIISSLNFTHVKAVIPSFMLKGYVILTSTLQKLGVRKIFEPRHADFSLMTKEPNLYVTNIEQSVTVTIRNYIDPEKLPNHRNSQQFRTAEFKADHPFLYFVMDSRIHVTLMAGKIVNPLNSRIR